MEGGGGGLKKAPPNIELRTRGNTCVVLLAPTVHTYTYSEKNGGKNCGVREERGKGKRGSFFPRMKCRGSIVKGVAGGGTIGFCRSPPPHHLLPVQSPLPLITGPGHQ